MGTTTRLPAALLPRGRFLVSSSLLGLCLLSASLPASSAANVRVLADGQTITLPTAGDTVREALGAARITLSGDDEVSPALDAPAPSNGMIQVRRVRYTQGTIDTKIPHGTTIRPATRTQRPYHPTVMAEGRDGIRRVTYRAKVVDGLEVERTTVSDAVVREPVPQVVVARKPAMLGSRGAYTGKRLLRVLATAYDPGPGSCGKYADGRTCNGKRAGYGIIAVDPKTIPLGTKMYVDGYGYGIAADVGSAIKGQRIDLGFNSRAGSFKWGKKWVNVTILD